MKRSIIFVVLGCMSFLQASFSYSGERDESTHPLVGKWQWTRSENKCTEVYEYKTDGTAPVTSGTEVTENTYTVDARGDSNGFHRITMRTTKDFGGTDCGDDDSDSTGLESTSYILFSPDYEMYIDCRERSLEACFGPFRRLAK